MTRTISPEQKQAMADGRKRAREARKATSSQNNGPHKEFRAPAALPPLKAIRQKCLDCGGNRKSVKYCTCDGVNSTRCELWPYRFGMGRGTAARQYGDKFLNPKDMPPANTPLEDLP